MIFFSQFDNHLKKNLGFSYKPRDLYCYLDRFFVLFFWDVLLWLLSYVIHSESLNIYEIYYERKTLSLKDLLIIMSNPQAAAAMARGGGLLQSVGDGSVVHSEENLVGGTVVQAYVNFTLMMCTHRTFCCFLKWYIEKQGPCHTLKEDSSEPRCFAPPAVFFLFVLISKALGTGLPAVLAPWPLTSYPRLLMLLTVSRLPHFLCLFASFTTNSWSASWLHDLFGSPRSDIKNIYHRKCFFNLSHISYFIYKMARLSWWPFSYQAHRLLCWAICEITSQKSRHLWRVTYRCWGLYIARGLNGLEIFLLLAKDLGVKLLTWEITWLGI